MPYDTPIENTIGVMQAVRDPEGTRRILEHYQAAEIHPAVDVPDYDQLERPLMEVFTLDSDTCAACAYMFTERQRRVFNELDGQVDLVEYKITEPRNIARVAQMGIKNLPCILINGELTVLVHHPQQPGVVGCGRTKFRYG
jgi:uroporphyrinogen decarboxylase